MVSARIPIFIAVVLLSLATSGNALKCFVCKDCKVVTNITEVATCKEITDTTTLPPTSLTDEPTKPQTDAPTKPPTDAPTKPPTDAPTDTPTDAPPKPPTDAAIETPNELLQEPYVIFGQKVHRQRRAAEESTFQCVKAIYKVGDKEFTDRGCQMKEKDEKTKASCARMTSVAEDKVIGCGVCEKDSCNSATILQISSPLLISLVYLIARSFF